MPQRPRGQSITRVLGEFVLIVVGVVVALMADGARENREVRNATESARDLLVDDLVLDSIQLAGALNLTSTWASSVLLANTDRSDLPADTLALAMRRLMLARPYRPIRATFDLLLQRDGLRHIGDIRDQSEIVRYYEQHQAQAVWWNEYFWENYDRLGQEVKRYTSPVGSSVESVMSEGWLQGVDRRLTAPWDVLRADNELMSTIFYRHAAWEISQRYLQDAIEANLALRMLLSEVDSGS